MVALIIDPDRISIGGQNNHVVLWGFDLDSTSKVVRTYEFNKQYIRIGAICSLDQRPD